MSLVSWDLGTEKPFFYISLHLDLQIGVDEKARANPPPQQSSPILVKYDQLQSGGMDTWWVLTLFHV